MRVEHVLNWITHTGERIQENKDYLSELDRAIGDGDHGVNIARGFQEVVNTLTVNVPTDIGGVFQTIAMTLISKVGGASGPLFGTAFLKAVPSLKGKQEVTSKELAEALKNSVEGIKQRGKSEQGQKTMIDVWEPVIEKWLKYDDQVNYDQLKDLTSECMENTKDLVAIKGRAAYLGERSVGHIDPGAASSYILFDTLFNELKDVD